MCPLIYVESVQFNRSGMSDAKWWPVPPDLSIRDEFLIHSREDRRNQRIGKLCCLLGQAIRVGEVSPQIISIVAFCIRFFERSGSESRELGRVCDATGANSCICYSFR